MISLRIQKKTVHSPLLVLITQPDRQQEDKYDSNLFLHIQFYSFLLIDTPHGNIFSKHDFPPPWVIIWRLQLQVTMLVNKIRTFLIWEPCLTRHAAICITTVRIILCCILTQMEKLLILLRFMRITMNLNMLFHYDLQL